MSPGEEQGLPGRSPHPSGPPGSRQLTFVCPDLFHGCQPPGLEDPGSETRKPWPRRREQMRTPKMTRTRPPEHGSLRDWVPSASVPLLIPSPNLRPHLSGREQPECTLMICLFPVIYRQSGPVIQPDSQRCSHPVGLPDASDTLGSEPDLPSEFNLAFDHVKNESCSRLSFTSDKGERCPEAWRVAGRGWHGSGSEAGTCLMATAHTPSNPPRGCASVVRPHSRPGPHVPCAGPAADSERVTAHLGCGFLIREVG